VFFELRLRKVCCGGESAPDWGLGSSIVIVFGVKMEANRTVFCIFSVLFIARIKDEMMGRRRYNEPSECAWS
jgi:hypothetical protein